ncbi:NAD(P)-dependent oxidoreductase [Luteibaculum oceani]|uniref:Saccharopine dehydrogenase [NAD(+), L-lysine-forming] n=1 Tax=Luteibaculum oceani TaxID=1294296 RepID=A0A5C6V4A6_9FLAO|nr:NAD(P)-dependent oxidoreductase [Luteibaculum oceani]TXC78538.1 alanine dehydrogenase [Luteibaculum oceani]
MKLGVIREGKTPPDRRVPLSPRQCWQIQEIWPKVEIVVQSSPIRAFSDDEYTSAGVRVVDDCSDCDVLLGVKEVPVNQLIPNKTYFFFSHTFKKQEYNKGLLKALLDKKIRLIDYEVVTAEGGRRLLGFGRYAGIVGAYNAFYAWGVRTGNYELKRAHECADRKELERELKNVKLDAKFKMVLTGAGRVAKGAIEILEEIGIRQVEPDAIINETFDHPVFAQLLVTDYNRREDGNDFTAEDFYRYPVGYQSNFMRFAKVSDMYIACHYWDNRSPFIFSREDAKSADFNVKVVADISCDIDCAVASTLRPSTISDPLYGYDPRTESEVDFNDQNAIGVMAVDNLPCELPRDASEDFGAELMNNVLPHLFEGDNEGIIERATQTTLDGNLTPQFAYLEDWVNS